jgi:hypothetical protein
LYSEAIDSLHQRLGIKVSSRPIYIIRSQLLPFMADDIRWVRRLLSDPVTKYKVISADTDKISRCAIKEQHEYRGRFPESLDDTVKQCGKDGQKITYTPFYVWCSNVLYCENDLALLYLRCKYRDHTLDTKFICVFRKASNGWHMYKMVGTNWR